MKNKLKGLFLGIFIGTLITGGAVYASIGTEFIEVTYNNIKVYKDNVLCELKDEKGNVIEPFIYKGTTYMPVRGTANLADMEVTWDGATKSVYLWDEMVPEGTYLMEVCPPYSAEGCTAYYQSQGHSFTMAGEKYSNGIILTRWNADNYALFNLNSKYSNIECSIGHINNQQNEKSASFYVDGKLVKEVVLEPECMPKKVSIPVSYGLQLKILVNGNNYSDEVGIGNITVK